MPKFLTYIELCSFYSLHQCTLDIIQSEFSKNVTKNPVPYRCPEGHLISNLTKNNFNARINQGRNPCAICSVGTRKADRETQIRSALEKNKCTLISLEPDRGVLYTCSCGRNCSSSDSNVLREGVVGCGTCANPFNKSEIQEKIREGLRNTYGCENQFQVPAVKEKIKETNLKRYGCENVMQNGKIFSLQKKSSYSKRPHTLPSGKIVEIMGYEDRCLDLLLETYSESDLLVEDTHMPVIMYSNPEKGGRQSRYYADIFIPSEKVVVEVKSEYTLKKELTQNLAKFQATVEQGFELHLYVFGRKTLLYKKVYRKESITVSPYPPAEIDWSELEEI
jgi:hypothetical protein